MKEPAYDLLADELIEVRERDDQPPRRLTLPGVLEALSAGDGIASFTQLQAHQAQAWYCFLCQLAAMALARGGHDDVEGGQEGDWGDLLLELTDGERSPWCLVVPDLSEPAFFQPPVPEGDWAALDKSADHPDDLDLLVTSTNHDVKISRMGRPDPAHWMYALASLQTTANYTGRGNYGVARKSSGYSCRPFVGLAPGLGWGSRFRRDVRVLLDERAEIADSYDYDVDGGLPLTFLRPWDGTDAIPVGELDPYFIEDCRRVRLRSTDSGLKARRTGTASRRVDAKEMAGNLGDPWTPVRVSDGTALNVSGRGFHYELVTELLLTGEYKRAAAAEIQPHDPETLFLVLQALSRGQGQTNGLHERIVPIPGHIRRRLMETEERQRLGERAEQRIEFVSTTKSEALRPALCALFQGDPDELDFQDDRPRPWLDRVDDHVDRIFFLRLWEQAELSAEEADLAWRREVLDLASDVLDRAIQRASVPEPRRYRGWAGAERIFGGARRRLLGAAAVAEEETTG